ncbi:MAG: sulfite exporter TauE/SafE family protein [Paracoccaceae bacterium]
MFDLTLTQTAGLLITVALASSLAGVLAGLLGVGGGIVIVPMLFWILTLTDFPPALTMHMAVATSLATIVFTSISSTRAHMRRGTVDMGLIRLWAPAMAIGALLGGLAARYVDPAGLKGVFGLIALAVALNMALPRTLVLHKALPARRAVNWALAGVTGLFSALMGIGGGTLSVPILTSFSVDIRRAVGTAAAFGCVIALPALVGFVAAGWSVPGRPPLSLGYVNLAAAALILPFTVFCAPIGAKLAHTLDTVWIKRAFAAFLGITALRMLQAAMAV